MLLLPLETQFQHFSSPFYLPHISVNQQQSKYNKDIRIMLSLTNNPDKINRDWLAAILIMLGSVSYSMGFIFVNQHKIHPILSSYIRAITLWVITYLYGRSQNMDLTFPSSHNFKWQIVRNSCTMIQTIVFTWTQFYLPLPVAITLNNTSPLFVVLYDRVFFNIKLNRTQLIWLAIAFIGVILTVNGQYIYSLYDFEHISGQTSFEHYLSTDPWTLLIVGFIMLIATSVHGFGVVMTKKIKNTQAIQITYFHSLNLLFFCAPFLSNAVNNQTYHCPDWKQFLWTILLCAIPSSIGSLAYIGALTISKNYGVITPFQFITILVGYLVSVFRYGESINQICLIGGIFIVTGIILIMRYKDASPS